MKNLRLRVAPDGSVLVSAPYGVSRASIDSFVESRSDWISRQRGTASVPSGLLEAGAITLFGKRLEVRVEKGENSCREEGSCLIISAVEPENEAKLEEIALSYMAERCRSVLEEAFGRFLALSGYVGERPKLRLKLMKSRWGSCSGSVITLNLLLCKLPERFSQYVAAHEVAHLFVPNHSDAFYAFGERLYPGFRRTDRELNRIRVGGLFS